ncbi:MAG: hypothetical protein ACRD19_05635 [Terriglobia bacterium]
MQRAFVFAQFVLWSFLGTTTAAFCQQVSYVTLAVNPSASGIEVPSDFSGLSFESETILPNAQGRFPMFRASNRPLLELFSTLGIGSLRIGGNTADRPDMPVPDDRDMDELFGFAKKAQVRVIYTLRLRDWSPDKDVAPARYLMSHYAAQLSCIAVGNEPNMYEKAYDLYSKDVARYFGAIGAAVPEAKFCGPGTTPSGAGWAAKFAESFGKTTRIEWITQHAYPASKVSLKTDLAAARLELLSPEVMKRTAAGYAAFGPEVQAAGLKYRIEETNSDFRMAGREGVSDSFASALWALDYMYWWAAHGAQGVNFHTGDTVAVKGGDGPCIYAVFRTAGKGYDVRPLGYAMKAFDLTGRGRLLPVSGNSMPDVSSYAVAGQDGNLYFTLIYKARSRQAQPVRITLDPGSGFGAAETMLLTSPGANLASTTGITLGGAAIGRNGRWRGRWSALQDGSRGNVRLMPDTALLVRFRPSK